MKRLSEIINIEQVKSCLKKTRLHSIYLRLVIARLSYRKDKTYLKDMREVIKNNRFFEGLTNEQINHWERRIRTVLESDDNSKIKCVKATGRIKKNFITMHNGLKVEALSYYGFPVLKMLMLNKTIHEPQEEYAFQTVLENMPKGATMIELGAFWSFYSMWFNKKVKRARNFMLEPVHLETGKTNFRVNKLRGNFFKYYVGEFDSIQNEVRIITVDSFMKENKINFVDILHSDIQGYELEMLKGSRKALSNGLIGYIFISTHSNDLHNNCSEILENLNYTQVCSADLNESYSWDGLIVYKHPSYQGIEKIEISLRTLAKDAFSI